MADEQIMFTCLPNGWVTAPSGERRPRLSVLVSPRLTDANPSTLASFADFVDWPTIVAGIRWTVTIGADTFDAVAQPSPAVDLPFDPWAALFPSATPVTSFAFPDLSDAKLYSYPAGKVQQFLKDGYTDLAANHPTDPVPIPELAKVDPFAGLRREEINALRAEHQALVQSQGYASYGTALDPPTDFVQLDRFYGRPQEFAGLKAVNAPLPDIPEPALDFHQAVALCGSHPHVMRLLSLVIGLEVVRGRVLASGLTEVRVTPSWTSPHSPAPVIVRPRTRAFISEASQVFRASEIALPGVSDYGDGCLLFDNAQKFTPLQIDTDGAGLKAIDFSFNLKRASQKTTEDTPDARTVHTLRSPSLGVARNFTALKVFNKTFTGSSALDASLLTGAEPGANTLFSIADLARGYRIDVFDDVSNRWHTLMARDASYEFIGAGGGIATTRDEGVTDLALVSAADPSLPDDEYYLQEEMFSWTGWSLVAARPGTAIDNSDTVVDASSEPTPNGFQLRNRFAPTRATLPRLRYGVRYRLRARLVDLAGNSMGAGFDPNAPASTGHPTPPTLFGRFDPVQSPTILPGTPRGPASRRFAAVVRSDYDTPIDLTEMASRHVSPSKVGQVLCEHTGMFDTTGPGSLVDPAAYSTIVPREAGSFETAGQLFKPPGSDTEDWYYPVAQVTMPFLPDPAAAGATLRGLPGSPTGVDRFDFAPASGTTWPFMRPFRIDLAEGPASGFTYDGASRVLKVRLAKADVFPVRVSAYMTASDVPRFGLVGWLEDVGLLTPQLEALIEGGQHWMVTPDRTMTLVHAVRRPLASPEYDGLGAAREPGWTYALLRDTMAWSRKSTSKLELLASWTEPVDDGPGAPDPYERVIDETVAVVVPLTLDRAVSETAVVIADKHEFGDTKHRNVDYAALATTKFAEYFTVENPAVTLSGVAGVNIDSTVTEGFVASALQVVSLTTGTAYSGETDYSFDAETGELARRVGSSIADPETVRVTYLARPIARHSEQPPVPKNILSSKRPDAPNVLYVLPTFGWSEGRTAAKITSNRHRRGIRVYMERPWWSSGDGEQLAVVLWPHPTILPLDPPSDIAAYVTRWGNDPVHNTAAHGVPVFVTPSAFPLRTSGVDSVLFDLDELPSKPVRIAPHDVAFDSDRKLWFCDIDIDAGNVYWPFVRVALARYQPDSLTAPNKLHLSRVILADFVQLAPDRAVSVVPEPGRSPSPRRRVTVSGRAYEPGVLDPVAPTMRAYLEQRDDAVGGDLGWNLVKTVSLKPVLNISGLDSWSGVVSFPSTITDGKFRLVIEEAERLRTDGALAGAVKPTGKPYTATGRRVVFVDIIEI